MTRPFNNLILIITFSRVLFAIIFILIFDIQNISSIYISLILVLLGQLSDNLDGFITRKYSTPTVEGYLQDSIADKLFLLGIFIAVQREFDINILIVWFVISRELLILSTRILIKNLNTFLAKLKIYSILYALFIRISMLFFIIQPICGDYTSNVLLIAELFLVVSLFPAIIGQYKIIKAIKTS